MIISNINSFQILDSRGNPTLKVEVVLSDGSKGTFEVPSGASTGIHEALELRDNNKEIYLGKSIYNVIRNINEIKEELYNKDFDQRTLDKKLIELDGTKNKSNLGANGILGISIAFAKASAKYYNLPLYDYLEKIVNNKKLNGFGIKPKKYNLFANIINGGLHSGNNLNIQEFMIIPNLNNTKENIRAISEIYHNLKKLIEKNYGKDQTNVGDEGGFAPSISKPSQALDLIMEAIEISGYKDKVGLALDAAASDFYNEKTKKYEIEVGKELDYKELTEYYIDLIQKYPIISLEDPFAEDDFNAWNYFMKKKIKTKIFNFVNNSEKLNIVGDDLLVTNPDRIKFAIKKNLCNSLLLKINQIGTLTESLEAFELANNKDWVTIVSHRSGETIDSFITDLTVALNSCIKLGAPARGERIAKYNRFFEIYNKIE